MLAFYSKSVRILRMNIGVNRFRIEFWNKCWYQSNKLFESQVEVELGFKCESIDRIENKETKRYSSFFSLLLIKQVLPENFRQPICMFQIRLGPYIGTQIFWVYWVIKVK